MNALGIIEDGRTEGQKDRSSSAHLGQTRSCGVTCLLIFILTSVQLFLLHISGYCSSCSSYSFSWPSSGPSCPVPMPPNIHFHLSVRFPPFSAPAPSFTSIAVPAADLARFESWVQYAAAAYCVDNVKAKVGAKLTCPPKNCPFVQQADTSVILSFMYCESYAH